jgi:hypothetical protein
MKSEESILRTPYSTISPARVEATSRRSRVSTTIGLLALLAGILVAFLAGAVRAEEWQNVGESTYVRNFVANGMPFTCIMVVSGGKMAGEVKTIACLEVKSVQNTKATVYEVPVRPRPTVSDR